MVGCRLKKTKPLVVGPTNPLVVVVKSTTFEEFEDSFEEFEDSFEEFEDSFEEFEDSFEEFEDSFEEFEDSLGLPRAQVES